MIATVLALPAAGWDKVFRFMPFARVHVAGPVLVIVIVESPLYVIIIVT